MCIFYSFAYLNTLYSQKIAIFKIRQKVHLLHCESRLLSEEFLMGHKSQAQASAAAPQATAQTKTTHRVVTDPGAQTALTRGHGWEMNRREATQARLLAAGHGRLPPPQDTDVAPEVSGQ